MHSLVLYSHFHILLHPQKRREVPARKTCKQRSNLNLFCMVQRALCSCSTKRIRSSRIGLHSLLRFSKCYQIKRVLSIVCFFGLLILCQFLGIFLFISLLLRCYEASPHLTSCLQSSISGKSWANKYVIRDSCLQIQRFVSSPKNINQRSECPKALQWPKRRNDYLSLSQEVNINSERDLLGLANICHLMALWQSLGDLSPLSCQKAAIASSSWTPGLSLL